MQQIKKIPYGNANYSKMKKDNQFYFVDKTKYIQEIENLGSEFLFFLRPRRFGKSLWLSILEHYYDINKKDEFEQLFGDTYIGKNPTPLKNTYPILKLNLSGIPTEGNVNEIKKSFDLEIALAISYFYKYYSTICFDLSIENDYLDISDATDRLR